MAKGREQWHDVWTDKNSREMIRGETMISKEGGDRKKERERKKRKR
jgi:hypothetical protein